MKLFHFVNIAKWSLLLLPLVLFCPPPQVGAMPQQGSDAQDLTILETAKTVWINGRPLKALEILERGIQEFPKSTLLWKLKGNILTTIRKNQEALQAYDHILGVAPHSLDVRWAKWSVLVRTGQVDLAVTELQKILEGDDSNPLIHLRLAQELRVVDRLEESVASYREAVALAPDLPGWRLSLARALFDVLQYDHARQEVEKVLRIVPRGSPVEAMARNLLMIVYGATKERGRRFEPIFSPEGSASDRKEWAMIRHDAWRLFAAGKYQEAEPILRKVLALRPSDHRATYELGATLMEIGQYEEAIQLLQKGIDLGPASGTVSEMFLDSLFRIGQSLAHLERWEEALLHFEILQELTPDSPPITEAATVPGEEGEENPDTPPALTGIPVLDRDKLAGWVERVKEHLPQIQEKTMKSQMMPSNESSSEGTSGEDSFLDVKPKKLIEPIYTRTSLMGRDADFSWFRFVIPSKMVVRDDMRTGTHEFIPINPGDTFFSSQQDLYLVFALATPSYDEVLLTAQCFLETSAISGEQSPQVQDAVVMSMNDQSGYFQVHAPPNGWLPGLYRCGLFVGDEVSAYSHVDEVRFRILETPFGS